MSDDHIAVKIDGVIYVKLDDVKPMRARIEKLEAALAHIYAWYPISVAGPLQTVHEIRDFASKALEGKDETIG